MTKFWSQRLTLLLLVALLSITAVDAQIPSLDQVVISYATSGDHTLIAGVTGQRVRIYRIYLFCNVANNVIFKDTASNSLHPVTNLTASQGFVLDLSQEPWFITAVGAGFVINLSASQQCSGRAYYKVS